MGILNEIKGGANVTSPKPSVGWITGAVVAVFLLIGVILIGLKAWGIVQQKVPATQSVMAPARVYIS